jgi:hypothetical protein
LFTFPRSRVYSSRTSCSRSETRGFEARRRGFSVVIGEEGAQSRLAAEAGSSSKDIATCEDVVVLFLAGKEMISGFELLGVLVGS